MVRPRARRPRYRAGDCAPSARRRPREATRRCLRDRLPHGRVRRAGLDRDRGRHLRGSAATRTRSRPRRRTGGRRRSSLRRRRLRRRRLDVATHRCRRVRFDSAPDRTRPPPGRPLRLRRRAPLLRRSPCLLPLRERRPGAPSRLSQYGVVYGRARHLAARSSREGRRRSAPPAWALRPGVPRRRLRDRALRGAAGRRARVPVHARARVPPVTTAATWADLLESEELAYVGAEPAREPVLAPLPDDLHEDVRAALPFDSLYAHQAEAWEAAARGEHVIVTTGTASGKTLAFNLPVADALARSPKIKRGRSRRCTSRSSVRPSTTATPSPSAAGRFASGRTWSSPTRTCSTSASSRTTTAGATSSR